MKREERSEPGLVSVMTQLGKAIHRRSSEELLGMRLKPYMALGYIRDHPGVTQHELESALFIDANGVVLMLNELEAAGLSVRKRDPNDRRRHLGEVTEAGKAAVDRAEKARETLEEEILADLNPEERATLSKLLRRVLEGILKATPEPAKL